MAGFGFAIGARRTSWLSIRVAGARLWRREILGCHFASIGFRTDAFSSLPGAGIFYSGANRMVPGRLMRILVAYPLVPGTRLSLMAGVISTSTAGPGKMALLVPTAPSPPTRTSMLFPLGWPTTPPQKPPFLLLP